MLGVFFLKWNLFEFFIFLDKHSGEGGARVQTTNIKKTKQENDLFE